MFCVANFQNKILLLYSNYFTAHKSPLLIMKLTEWRGWCIHSGSSSKLEENESLGRGARVLVAGMCFYSITEMMGVNGMKTFKSIIY